MFLNQVLYFEALVEVLTIHGWKFFRAFEALYIKALKYHRTTSRDHLKADGLTKQVAESVKYGLQKYGLFYGNHCDLVLILLWIAIGYLFTKKTNSKQCL